MLDRFRERRLFYLILPVTAPPDVLKLEYGMVVARCNVVYMLVLFSHIVGSVLVLTHCARRNEPPTSPIEVPLEI